MAFADIPIRANGDTITASWFNSIRTEGITIQSSSVGFSLNWVEDTDAPYYAIENHIETYQYGSGLSQNLWTFFRVPTLYAAGSQITLKKSFYSSGTSGTGLLTAHAYLIRPGTELITSESNVYVSTNAAVSFSASTASKLQLVTFDLTTSAGKIGGLDVAANDYIKVRITRGTDTSTSDLKLVLNGDEVALG